MGKNEIVPHPSLRGGRNPVKSRGASGPNLQVEKNPPKKQNFTSHTPPFSGITFTLLICGREKSELIENQTRECKMTDTKTRGGGRDQWGGEVTEQRGAGKSCHSVSLTQTVKIHTTSRQRVDEDKLKVEIESL